MSYCRWSSDGFRSDVYTYADVDGSWTTHVAGRKKVGLDTLPPDPLALIGEMPRPEWLVAYKAFHDAYDQLEFADIDHPHSGDTFNDESPQACAATLKMLRGLGYHVPDGVIEELEGELAEEEASEVSDDRTAADASDAGSVNQRISP